ncbi:hypothetical protein A9Q99_01825 [Gammaproteobacteria bacterium 45_16_T64]|nr:hypothetical protein A9Q99_01825 [Gammaproteobacteria bacterium 45_16_T64]
MSTNSNRHLFNRYAESKEAVAFDDLAEIFATLEPIDMSSMIGPWQGGIFKSGTLIDWTLKDYGFIKWIGKEYVSKNNVKALMHNFLGFKFNFPVIGRAQIRPIQFRGKLSTSMIYNHLPIIDHFRKVDDNTLMGAMDLKGRIVLYFYLYR